MCNERSRNNNAMTNSLYNSEIIPRDDYFSVSFLLAFLHLKHISNHFVCVVLLLFHKV